MLRPSGNQEWSQEWLQDRLAELQRILHDMGPDFSGFAATAEELRGRLNEGRFRLAVLGQFKRGKSSLLNALLGEPLLPTGVLPLTSVPTMLRYGPERQVRVALRNGRREDIGGSLNDLARALIKYVTEQANPANRLGVTHVEVDHPAALLAKGVEIIDTPGIGSTAVHNTRTAREMLPVCDGALFVLSPDPPITDVEVQFLRAVHEAAARVIFVLTKADMLTPAERPELLTFLQKVLHDEAGFSDQERIFLVSARRALEAHAQGNEPALAQSGLGELESFLVEFLSTDKRAALRQATRIKAARLVRDSLFTLDLQRKAIELPRQELERRSERFDAHLATLDRERVYFADRLAGDRRRMLDDLDRQSEAVALQAREALEARVEKVRAASGPGAFGTGREGRIGKALSEEVDRVFGRAARDLSAAVTARFKTIQDIHCHEIETLLERVRRTAADLFEVPDPGRVGLDRTEGVREPRVIHHRWVTSFTEEAASWVVKWMPVRLRTRLLQKRLQEDIEYLVARNVEELRWATRQNLEETFRGFQARMEAQLDATTHAIRLSVQVALEHQAQRESRLAPASDHLADFRERLMKLLTALSPAASSVPPIGPV
jgi:predicted GTPase